MGGMENLIKLKVNLKNWSWRVEPKFVLDENDAKALIAEIETIEKKRGKKHGRNKNSK